MPTFDGYQAHARLNDDHYTLGDTYKAPPPSDKLVAGYGYDQVTGTYVAPYTSSANVRDGINRGDGVLGTCAVPAATDVRSGVATDSTVGTAHIPPAAAVLSGVPVDATVGTYIPPVPDYPAATDVRHGISYADDLLEGSLMVPDAGNVRLGIVYDANTVGELSAQPVPAPVSARLLHHTSALTVHLRNKKGLSLIG